MSKLHSYLPIHQQSLLKTCCFPLCRFELWTQRAFRDSSTEDLFYQGVFSLIITDSFTKERFSLGYLTECLCLHSNEIATLRAMHNREYNFCMCGYYNKANKAKWVLGEVSVVFVSIFKERIYWQRKNGK